MAIDGVWLSLAINVAVGTIAGGVTNAIAVWMLFHPYERRYGLQGAIPKNKARLARSIGKTVGERLLTPADVLEELNRANLRETFDAKLTEVLVALLETERGSLRALLPPAVFAEVERVAQELAPAIAARVAQYVDSPECEAQLRRTVARLRADVAARPVGAVLTPARRAALAARAAGWAEELAEAPELERGVREYLAQHAGTFLASPRPLLEQVPAPVVRALEAAIDAYLPLAVARLGEFLHHPAARERIREALHGLFQRFVDDLRFHERVIARLMVTERTFDKAIDSIERDGVEQMAALLDDPVVREEITRTIHEAVIGYLHKPLGEIVGGAEGERAQALVRTVGDYVLRVLRSPRTRGFLVDKLHVVLERAEERTWGELLAPLDDDTIVRHVLQAARTPRTATLVEDVARAALRGALERPIGRPGRWLPPEAPARLAAVVAPASWAWMQAQLPGLLERLNVQAMVERKVLGFSTARLEEILRTVTQRELELIVRLGYVLGAMIGLLTFALSSLLPRLGVG